MPDETPTVTVSFVVDEAGNVNATIPPGVPIQAMGVMLLILSRAADGLLDMMMRGAAKPIAIERAQSIPQDMRRQA